MGLRRSAAARATIHHSACFLSSSLGFTTCVACRSSFTVSRKNCLLYLPPLNSNAVQRVEDPGQLPSPSDRVEHHGQGDDDRVVELDFVPIPRTVQQPRVGLRLQHEQVRLQQVSQLTQVLGGPRQLLLPCALSEANRLTFPSAIRTHGERRGSRQVDPTS